MELSSSCNWKGISTGIKRSYLFLKSGTVLSFVSVFLIHKSEYKSTAFNRSVLIYYINNVIINVIINTINKRNLPFLILENFTVVVFLVILLKHTVKVTDQNNWKHKY